MKNEIAVMSCRHSRHFIQKTCRTVKESFLLTDTLADYNLLFSGKRDTVHAAEQLAVIK
jgi:hypothetical protein